MMMMNDDHNGEGDNDGEDNEFLTRIQQIHHKNPGFEATPPTRCTIQRLHPSDIGFASFSWWSYWWWGKVDRWASEACSGMKMPRQDLTLHYCLEITNTIKKVQIHGGDKQDDYKTLMKFNMKVKSTSSCNLTCFFSDTTKLTPPFKQLAKILQSFEPYISTVLSKLWFMYQLIICFFGHIGSKKY